MLAWIRLARVFQKMQHISANQFRSLELNGAQFDVLMRVSTAEGLTQQQLADTLLVTKGNVCQLLDKMEQSGLLHREQEGRSNKIFLTEHGRSLLEQVVPVHEELLQSLFSSLTEDEQRTFLSLIRRLDHALR